MAPAEIPLGIVTALTGGPFFLYLLLYEKTGCCEMKTDRIETMRSWLPVGGPAIEVEGLSFRYRTTDGRGRMWTLDHLSSMSMQERFFRRCRTKWVREVVAVESSSGFLPAGEGDVRLGGLSLGKRSQADIARLVAVVPQEYAQVFPFTVAETVLMGRFPHPEGTLVEHWSRR